MVRYIPQDGAKSKRGPKKVIVVVIVIGTANEEHVTSIVDRSVFYLLFTGILSMLFLVTRHEYFGRSSLPLHHHDHGSPISFFHP
jgi:hypothetical protein